MAEKELFECEDCNFPEVCEKDCQETSNITKIEYIEDLEVA